MELQLKVINLPCFCLQKRDSPMEWTESHDVALCKEVLVQNPFLARKKTVQRAAISRGGDSHMKQTGMLVGNFEFNP